MLPLLSATVTVRLGSVAPTLPVVGEIQNYSVFRWHVSKHEKEYLATSGNLQNLLTYYVTKIESCPLHEHYFTVITNDVILGHHEFKNHHWRFRMLISDKQRAVSKYSITVDVGFIYSDYDVIMLLCSIEQINILREHQSITAQITHTPHRAEYGFVLA